MLRDFKPRLYQETILNTAVRKNTLVVLPTGMGKCLSYEEPVLFSDGTIEKIGEYVEHQIKQGKITQNKEGHIIAEPKQEAGVLSLNEKLGFEQDIITYVHKIKADKKLIKLTTASGASMSVTQEHPLLSLNNHLAWRRADSFTLGEYLAAPKKINLNVKNTTFHFLDIFKDIPRNYTVWLTFKPEFAARYKIKTPIEFSAFTRLLISTEEIKKNLLSVHLTGKKCVSTPIKPIWEISGELLYWLGLVIAEGRLCHGIEFYNDDSTLLKIFISSSERLFGIRPELTEGGLRVRSTALVFFLRNAFNLTMNQHSRDKFIPKNVLIQQDQKVARLLSALFDGDGSISKKDIAIELSSASPDLINKVAYLLLRFGIRARIKDKWSQATNSPHPRCRKYYKLYFCGREDLAVFSKYIQFRHPLKKKKLAELLSKNPRSNTNVKVIPLSAVIREIRNTLRLSSTFGKDFNCFIDIYERGQRKPTTLTLAKIILGFEKKLNLLNKLTNKVIWLKQQAEILKVNPQKVSERVKILLEEQLPYYLTKAKVPSEQFNSWVNGRHVPKLWKSSPYPKLIKMLPFSTLHDDMDIEKTLSSLRILRGALGISKFSLRKENIFSMPSSKEKLIKYIFQIIREYEKQVLTKSQIIVLKKLCRSDIFWDKIIKIEEVKAEYVYDFSILNHANFIAGYNGGLVAHNTGIALMLTVQRLTQYPQSKILVLSPTKPLCDQHAETFRNHLEINPERIVIFTGNVAPEKREKLWKEAQVIISTPQGLENDVINKKIDLGEVSLLVFDECVAPGTLVSLADGRKIKIEDLDNSSKEIFVESINEKTGNLEPAKVIQFHKIKSHKPIIKIITKESNINTTSDHLFLTQSEGRIQWKTAKDLKSGLNIAFVPDQKLLTPKILVKKEDILVQYSIKQQRLYKQYQKTINLRQTDKIGARKISNRLALKESAVRNWINKPYQKPVLHHVLKEIEKIGFLPLTSDNIYLPLFARLFGHIYGDGWAYKDKRNNLVLGFSGRVEALKEIQQDLQLMGIKYSNIHSRITKSEINSTKKKVIVVGTTNSFLVSDVRLTRLFSALKIPVGNKTTNCFFIPNWIMRGTDRIKKEFLSALMGSEGHIPTIKKNGKTCHPVRMSFNLVKDLLHSGKRYANQIKRLFSNFNIPISLSFSTGNIRKDGKETIKFILTLSNSNSAMISFLQKINYTYCPKKRIAGNAVLHYLHLKDFNLKERISLCNEAKRLRQIGFGSTKIARMLKLDSGTIENWIYNRKIPTMITATMPRFDSGAGNLLNVQWAQVVKLKEGGKEEWVYDLTVEKNHNYIANNCIVHNCHHATGDYSYVWLAKQYDKAAKFPRILALTASPGSDMEKIKEVCQNLLIEEVEVRTNRDPDVKPYIQEVNHEWIKVGLPEELMQIKKYLETCYLAKLKEVQGYGYCSYLGINKTELIKLQGELQGKISSGEREIWLLKSISLVAEALKIQHALELLETQGVKSLNDYLEKLQSESYTTKVRAVQNLVRDGNFKSALVLVRDLSGKGIKHPKLIKLKEIIQEEVKKEGIKVIIFTQFRDNASEIVKELNSVEGVSAKIFVGQLKKKDTGLSQKQQKEVLDEFREGKFNTCIMTSVGEEGLDVPSVDLVIFYEPIPSAIRTIQRKGRTGRLEKGRVLILMTEKTRDEGYRWSAFHKEKRMYRDLEQIKKSFSLKNHSEVTLNSFVPEGIGDQSLQGSSRAGTKEVLVLADHREKSGGVVKELIDLGISLELKQLESADYVLSGRVGVEKKRVADFVNSIIDGRLLEQVKNLKKGFERSLLIIEGEEDIYTIRRVHANAIRGMLAAITIGYGVPVLYTKNPKDTAGLLAVIAKREQDKERDYSLHERKPLTLKEQQEFMVSALPGIGLNTAKLLLEHFGSIKKLVNASYEEIVSIKGAGEKTAEKLVGLFDWEYRKE